uniref:Uncharacterized protein n=1 Tax=Cacopsylla melanoneura TaxID=428564 RepID=A0A8D8TBK0_9HEMI
MGLGWLCSLTLLTNTSWNIFKAAVQFLLEHFHRSGPSFRTLSNPNLYPWYTSNRFRRVPVINSSSENEQTLLNSGLGVGVHTAHNSNGNRETVIYTLSTNYFIFCFFVCSNCSVLLTRLPLISRLLTLILRAFLRVG